MSIEASITKCLGKNFTLEVDLRTDGGCLGILGASGSGKSMTLKCIAGIETPDAGRIVVNGRTLFDSAERVNLRPQRRRVGYLFQNYALFPRMTTEENIGAGVSGPPAERRRTVSGLMARFRLEGLEKLLPHQLSGGQQQRAALARMLAAAPDILLLDEPFSALDSHLREQMQLGLGEIIRERRDVVMVTHSRDEAYKLCGNLLILDGGRGLGQGGTQELFDNPKKLRIARLTGCKNFSRMERISPHRIRALDWDLELNVKRQVPDGVDYIGVRAHDLVPLADGEVLADNVVELRVKECSEEPFERTVVFTNAAAGPTGSGDIWWKYSKYAAQQVPPRRLRIPPGAVLFLRSDGVDPDKV